jgi:type I restriction enzyme R subunit
MKAEDERAAREELSEDELEIFDLLMKDGLTQDEIKREPGRASPCPAAS